MADKLLDRRPSRRTLTCRLKSVGPEKDFGLGTDKRRAAPSLEAPTQLQLEVAREVLGAEGLGYRQHVPAASVLERQSGGGGGSAASECLAGTAHPEAVPRVRVSVLSLSVCLSVSVSHIVGVQVAKTANCASRAIW